MVKEAPDQAAMLGNPTGWTGRASGRARPGVESRRRGPENFLILAPSGASYKGALDCSLGIAAWKYKERIELGSVHAAFVY